LEHKTAGGTGAAYSMLPSHLPRRLGLESTGKSEFEPAAGQVVEMDKARVWITITDASEVSLAFFGDDDAPPLLGTYALEGLRLAADPVQRRLVATSSILYQAV